MKVNIGWSRCHASLPKGHESSPTSIRDKSITELFQDSLSIIVVDTGIPKSTGEILNKVKKEIPSEKWHQSLGDVWEGMRNNEVKNFGEFKDFIDKIVERLKKYKDPKTGKLKDTNLWIPEYEGLKQEFEKNNIHAVCKFTGSGGGGSLLMIIEKKDKKRAISILKRLLKKEDKEKVQCRLFNSGCMTDYQISSKTVDFSRKSKSAFWWCMSLLLSSICLFILYFRISTLYNEFNKNKSSSQITFIILSSMIVLALFMIPVFYKLYTASCKVIPIHIRNAFQKVILYKWKFCKRIGKLVDLSESRGGIQTLIWIVTLFWSNIVFIFLLLLSMFFL